MTQILKNHRWAIILALLASVVIVYPQVYLRYDLRDVYQGIETIGAKDERAWLSRVREAYDGHPTLSNAYFKEGKDDPYLIQPLGSNIVASFGKVFSLDINNAVMLSRIVMAFFVFLLIYGFVFLLTKERMVALSVSSFLVLANALFSRTALFQLLKGLSPSVNYINYTRPVNPLMTSFFFFGFLFCFWLFLEKKQWRYGILSVLALGLSFYDYFYTWTFLYAFLGVLAIIFLFQKNWLNVKRIALVAFGSIIVALPYLLNLYRATTYPNYVEIGQRIGLLDGRTPVLGFAVPLLFIIFLLLFPRQWKSRYWFCLGLVAAPFIALNQQLITGKALSTAHYHWYFNMPLVMIFLMLIFFHWASRPNLYALKKAAAILIVAVSVIAGFFIQQSSYAANREGIINYQKYGRVMDWLSQNARKDEVVLSNPEAAEFIVIYTPLNVFYHYTARISFQATTERLKNILFTYYRLDGLRPDKAEEIFLGPEESNISKWFFGHYYRDATGNPENLPDEFLVSLAGEYQKSFALTDNNFFEAMLKMYDVKYIVWDKEADYLWQLDRYPFLAKKAEIGNFTIYQYERSQSL